ncbi:MAG: Hpt domain-containing protein, partial [Aquabacterium sp.]|nr:Hpt domain-containing protein [Aquabacterium sp.]
MVGLKEYGEAGWACEQMYNAWLASQAPASEDLQAVTAELLGHFALWTDAISAKQDAGWTAQPVIEVADALRLHGQRKSLSDAGSGAAVEPDGGEPEEPAPAAPVIETLAEPAPVLLDEPKPVPLGVDWELPSLDQAVDELAEQVEPVVAPLSFDDLALPDAVPTPVESVEMPELALPELETVVETVVESDTVLDPEALPEVDTQPQALTDESLAEHELIVLDLDAATSAAPSSMVVETIHAPSKPADLYSEFQEAAEEPLAEVTLTDPKEFVLLDDNDPTQAGDLVDLPAGEVEASEPVDAAAPVEPAEPGSGEQVHGEQTEPVDEQVKVVGPLRISIPLFNIYLNEADEQSRRLSTSLGEWALELHRPVGDDAIALAHSLAGNSGTVGYTELSQLARLLEHA